MNIGFIGFDGGYNAVKVTNLNDQTTFPSVVGTPDTARFSLNATSDVIIEYNGESYLVGESAVLQSRMIQRREDRHWFQSEQYIVLYLAALSAMSAKADVNVITGLPMAFFSSDKDALKSKLTGEFVFNRCGNQFKVNTSVKVVPQPFGTLFDIAMDKDGDVINTEVANGTIGVIDCGGKTTNLLAVSRLSEIGRETSSVNVGGWDVIRALQNYINNEYPNRDFRDHELAQIVKVGSFTYFGEKIDVRKIVDEISKPLAEQVIAQASQLWNGGASLDKIVVTGGGTHLLGQHICNHFPHAEPHHNPVFGNAAGYAKLAVYNGKR